MTKWARRRKLKLVAEKYEIKPRWLFEISREKLWPGTLKKLAAKILLARLGFKGNVRFAGTSPILSPATISKLASIPTAWFFYHGLRAMPLWRWRMFAWRLPDRQRCLKVLSALAEFERQIDELARMGQDALTFGKGEKHREKGGEGDGCKDG